MLSPQVEGKEAREIAPDVNFGKGSKVLGNQVSIGAGTIVGDGVTIKADTVRIGRRCKIEDRVKSGWKGGNAKLFAMGDCCILGEDSRVLVKDFIAGDYVVLHNHLLANGDGTLDIGNNAWMGQNGILNANMSLRIGNNVGIGAYSAVWTHGKFGSLIDGCLMHKEAPVVIGDDACLWRAVVSPGVKVGRRVTVLPGSILTKDAPNGSCFGGVPAEDLSSKVKTYRKVTIEEQFEMMGEFITDFVETHYPGSFVQTSKDDFLIKDSLGSEWKLLLKWTVEDPDIENVKSAIVVGVKDATTKSKPGVSVFDLTKRTYTKWLTDPEVEFMWFMLDSRARFSPKLTPKIS